MNGHAERRADQGTSLVKDPVCGMDVDPVASKHRVQHGGETFYFCSEHCQARFESSPEKYLDPPRDSAHEHGQRQPVGRGDAHAETHDPREVTEWTCPMHPEIRRPGPGSCPICGMALEPKTLTAEPE
jgi:Cu+-exporting ATPase